MNKVIWFNGTSSQPSNVMFERGSYKEGDLAWVTSKSGLKTPVIICEIQYTQKCQHLPFKDKQVSVSEFVYLFPIS